jgi:L-seryl-tRNA(Ser) seleniumtransferase
MPSKPKSTPRRTSSPSSLRALPSVDSLVSRPAIAAAIPHAGRPLVTQAARATLAQIRAQLKKSARKSNHTPPDSTTPEAIERLILENIHAALAPSLRRVINATGVVLHTNLGRAPLSSSAAQSVAAAAQGYTNLEFDLPSGARGKRDTHISRLLALATSAEAAIVVNNNAAAVFLALHSLAKNFEVIVSRGELIEIGDGFRIPDIMNQSGAILREVGTTNRTRVADYQRAINKNTRLLLRVHLSNFRVSGFTARPSLAELVALGRKSRIPVFEDLGSGRLTDLRAVGMDEPIVKDSLDAGVDVVSFSGDKLLGGPQAGVIAGKRALVEQIRRNPLFRALRVDKMTLAALAATLRSCIRGAFDEIPALQMIRATPSTLSARATSFAARLRSSLAPHFSVNTLPGKSVIGGGSTPGAELPTTLISLASPHASATALAAHLRQPPTSHTPVVARIEKNRLLLDLRTVSTEEENDLLDTIAAVAAISKPAAG